MIVSLSPLVTALTLLHPTETTLTKAFPYFIQLAVGLLIFSEQASDKVTPSLQLAIGCSRQSQEELKNWLLMKISSRVVRKGLSKYILQLSSTRL